MNRNTKSLSKKDISAPLQDSFQQLNRNKDSGLSLPDVPIESNEPYFDASASQVGGPSDPRVKKAMLPPQKLTSRQLQSFVQSVGAFRRQVQAMSAASEMFARSLESLKEVVPNSNITDELAVSDLEFLIDSTQLISNSHQIWASNIQSDVEEPLMAHLAGIQQQSSKIERDNRSTITDLSAKLQKEEDLSYKLGKKNKRDLATLQNSLNVRMSLADEIKRLSLESATFQDALCSSSMDLVLKQTGVAVNKELEAYEVIMEGLKKLGGYDPNSVKRRETIATTVLDN